MDNDKKNILSLAINALILVLNGLLAMLTPTTQKVAMDLIGGMFNA